MPRWDADASKQTVTAASKLMSVNNETKALEHILSGELQAFVQGKAFGLIAYNAAAPTPAETGEYTFSTAGLCSWLTDYPTDKNVVAGDKVLVIYDVALETYSYKLVKRPDNVASQMVNDSSVEGASVKHALETLGAEKLGTDKVSQMAGTSTTDVMCQNAVMKEISLRTESGLYINHTATNSAYLSEADGSFVSSPSHRSTDYIAVVEGQIVIIDGAHDAGLPSVIGYNASKTMVSSLSLGTGVDLRHTIVIPSGISYIRACCIYGQSYEIGLIRKKVDWLKEINIYVPDSLKDHDFIATLGGYNTEYDRFYFALKDKTAGTTMTYDFKSYASMPTIGTERINHFLTYDRAVQYGIYLLDITIDWDKYNIGDYWDGTAANHIWLSADVKSNLELSELHGTIYLNTRIDLVDGMHLKGKNCKIEHYVDSKITMIGTSSIENITFNYMDVNKLPERIEEEGTEYRYVPLVTQVDVASGANGIIYGSTNPISFIDFSSSAKNAMVANCVFNNYGACVILSYNSSRHFSANHDIICNNVFNFCRTAIISSEEFIRIYGNHFHGGIFGIISAAGNQLINECFFIRMDCGMFLPTGNDGHSMVSMCEFAHNNLFGIYAKEVGDMLGYIFNDCHLAQAPVYAESAIGLKFQGCRLDTSFTILAGSKNSFIGNNMRDAYAIAEGLPVYNVPSDTLLALNRSMVASQSDDLYNILPS